MGFRLQGWRKTGYRLLSTALNLYNLGKVLTDGGKMPSPVR